MNTRKFGNTLLAFVLAFALALPAPALAFAAEAGGGAASLQAGTIDQLEAGDATAQDVNADIWDGSVDTSWYSATATDFTLTKPAQLAGLAAIVNGTAVVNGTDTPIAEDHFTGKTVRLGADIALNASPATAQGTTGQQRSWVPIGNMELLSIDPDGAEGAMPHYNDGHYFDGTFDGQGHVVKNLYIYDNTAGTYGGVQALIANAGGHAVIRDTGIDGGYVYGRVAAGLVAASHAWKGEYPHIIGCFNSANVVCNGSSTRGAGGIFGGEEQYRGSTNEGGENYHGGAYIANCYNTGTIGRLSTSNCSVGGIAGTGSVQIYGCYNYGMVDVGASMYSGAIAGNLVGPGINVGQDSGIGFEGTACVHDSYAREGTIPADEYSLVKLYNLIDAEHGKGQQGERNPAVTDADDVKFKAASWFASEEAEDALSQSFDAGEGERPVLYWQLKRSQIDFTSIDSYGYNAYEVWGIGRQTYTGSPITPKVNVSYEAGEFGNSTTVMLHEGSDYLVEYANNTNIGTATVTVTGMGRFFNAQTTTFEIIDGDLDSATIAPILAQWWYGQAVTPDITVYASNGDVLKEGRDYQVEWANTDPSAWTPAASAGAVPTATATVTVKPVEGDSKFAGEKSQTFTILQASTELDGAGTAENPKKISSKADLQFLAYKTHTGDDLAAYSGYSYVVTADIDARSTDATYKADRPCDPLFTAWGYYDEAAKQNQYVYGFGGTFDGGGHTITLGLTETGASFDISAALALMVYTKAGSNPVVKNLVVDGSVLCPHGAAAGFLIMGQSGHITFTNCKNKAEVRGDAYYAGGAAGFVVETSTAAGGRLTMTDCVNEGAITSAGGRAGGFVSGLGGKGGSLSAATPTYANTFTNCVNKGAITGGSENGSAGFVAVILGVDDTTGDATNRTTLFERCGNEARGAVTVTSGDVGGLVGVSQNRVQLVKLDRCYNKAPLSGAGSGNNGGGLVGRVYNSAEVTNCYNTGDVRMRGSYSNNGAGIIGYFGSGYNDSTSLLLRNVYAAGAFTGPDADSGGLVGNIWLHTSITLDNVYYDSASASKWVGWNPADDYPSAVSPPVITGQATAIDADAMKTPTFLSQLGVAFDADSSDSPANRGFPVIAASDRVVTDLSGSGIEMRVDPGTWQYTGAPVQPKVTIETNGGELVEGTDFVVFYASKGDGSTWTAIAQGVGNYTGEVSKDFTVTACSIGECSISPVRPVSYSDIAGIGATQALTVTNPAGSAMTEGIDYRVIYSQNLSAGTAYARIEGIGPNYTGSALRVFTVTQGDLGSSSQVRIENVASHYPLSNGSGGLFIYEQLYANSGYKLQRADTAADNGDYARQFYDADGKIVLTDAGNAATSITKAGSYTVKFIGNAVRDLGNGQTQVWTNGNWTGVAQATFTYGNRMAVDADISGVASQYGYTGRPIAITPAIVNELTDYPLVKDTDYEMEIRDSSGTAVKSVVYAGNYKLVVTGINDWFGTVEVPFEVVPAEYFIDDDTVVSGIDAVYQYTGTPVKPMPTSVKAGGRTLVESVDYKVSYVDANGNEVASLTEPGTYHAVIAGIGLYAGSKSVPFTIEKPFISVYVKTGDAGAARLARAYTRADFVALKSDGDPVSALYCDMTGSNWSVATTAEYVTLADLLSDAGVAWGAGAKVTYGGDGDKSATTFTYEQLQGLMFYPSTTRLSADSFGGVPAPFVLSITDFSSQIGSAGTTTAYEAEQFNLRNANSTNSARTIMGVQPSDYVNPTMNVAKMRGMRLWNKTDALTITLPDGTSPDPGPSDEPGGSDSPGTSDGQGGGTGGDVSPGGSDLPSPSSPSGASSRADSSSGTGRAAEEGVSMYRLYNPYSGEHFYTSDAAERDNLESVGWVYEGVAWNAPERTDMPVFRLYNPYVWDHHYTTDAAERDYLASVGWVYEGVGWYSADTDASPLFRLYNPYAETGTHHYTSDAAERDSLVEVGWIAEGVGWYGA